jgi:DNA-binding transcriptional MerR regulator
MTIDEKDMINSILASVSRVDYIKPEDLPNIDLYMDQVTTFIEEQLASTKRHENDKILTKTMINNYAKNKLLPPPEKKRYSKEHLLMLIFIYYFKNILSINDIQTLMGPITEKYFKSESGKDLTYIYNEVFSMEKNQIEYLKKDLLKNYNVAETTFEDADPEDQEFLKKFSFICLLSFDVYMKKMLIEHLIDGIAPAATDKNIKKEKGHKQPKE